ncbi:MAG: VapC toxin family PIN domain ribonuclease [Roseateles sp.]|uniref:TA system VapC family ribonuclease toxin n=1 Tax=Roseateles sp. TaxID=1971397 RepID=UPI0039ED1FB5
MRSLLDVNVLLALLDANHIHHHLTMSWWSGHFSRGWASCPLTQNGALRILSGRSYLNRQAPGDVAERLALAAAQAGHEFWADDISLLEPGAILWDRVTGSRQITDIYLLALAVRRGGCLVTLDRGIAVQAVRDVKPNNLLVLA